MNPFLERHWSDVHTRMLTYLGDALAEVLPPDLVVRAEERISVASDDQVRPYRADVAVLEAGASALPPGLGTGRAAITPTTEPEVVLVAPTTERWLEIRAGGSLVTVIEVLSPANKRDEGRAAYRSKQRDYIEARVNLVEIDLLRGGQHTVAVSLEHLRPVRGSALTVCVSRAAVLGRREVYRWALPQRLPVFRVPLRVTDADVVVDLQPIIDRCYVAGRYWLNDGGDLDPPLSPEEAAWAAAQLRATGR
jgi:hypothetical protein